MTTIDMLVEMRKLWSLTTLAAMLGEHPSTIRDMLGGVHLVGMEELDERIATLYRQTFKPKRTVRRPWWTKEQREALAWVEERGWSAKDIIDMGLDVALNEVERRHPDPYRREEIESTDRVIEGGDEGNQPAAEMLDRICDDH